MNAFKQSNFSKSRALEAVALSLIQAKHLLLISYLSQVAPLTTTNVCLRKAERVKTFDIPLTIGSHNAITVDNLSQYFIFIFFFYFYFS